VSKKRAIPRRPFRDSAIFYAILSAVVIIVGILTGNRVLPTLAVAAVFFLIATSYSWWRWQRRLDAENRSG
jgi:hypothetical protein